MAQLRRQKEFKNPPKISDDPAEQLKRAYLWHVQWGWTKKDACDKSGCTVNRLNNAIDAGGPDNVAKPGAKSLLTEAVMVAVLKTLNERAISLQAVSLERGNPDSLYQVILKEIQRQQSNTLAIVKEPDWKTLQTWAAQVLTLGDCVKRVAEMKARGRKNRS